MSATLPVPPVPSPSFRTALAAVVLLHVAGSARAIDPNPSHARGLVADTPMLTDAQDDVNLFNANVVVRVPIGPSYPQNGKLSLQLTAVYNMNFWREVRDQCCVPTITSLYDLITSGGDLGPGWILRPFGRIPAGSSGSVSRWDYEDASGARHRHRVPESDLEPPTGSPGGPLSLDMGLEWFEFIPNIDNPTSVKLHQTDGTVITFGHRVAARWNDATFSDLWEGPGTGIYQMAENHNPVAGWYPTEVRDVHGNQITLCYHTDAQRAAHLLRSITDSVGRTITFTVRPPSALPAASLNVYQSVTYPVSAGRTATIQFAYDSKDLYGPLGSAACFQNLKYATLGPGYIGCPQAGSCGLLGNCQSNPAVYPCGDPYHASVLKEIVVPANGPTSYSYSFTTNASGEVTTWTSLRGASYTYTLHSVPYRMSYVVCDNDGLGYNWCNSVQGTTWSRGVSQRDVLVGTTTYTWYYDPDYVDAAQCYAGGQSRMTVTDPNGDDTVYYYWNDEELEMSRVGGNAIGSSICDDNPNPDFKGNCDCVPRAALGDAPCSGEDAYPGSWAEGLLCQVVRYSGSAATGTKLQTEDLQWDQSVPGDGYGVTLDPHWLRTVARRVKYHDDGDRYHLVKFEDYDGYGHFGSEVHSGTVGRDDRKFTTTWTPDTSTSWMLDKYTNKKTYSGSPSVLVAEADYAFNADGRLGTEWVDCYSEGTYADCKPPGGVPHQARHWMVWNNPGNGNLRYEEWTRPGSQYSIVHEHQNGVRSKSYYGDFQSARQFVWNILERTIDPAGVIASEKDPSGVQSMYLYDLIGRVTQRTRTGQDNVFLTYPAATEARIDQGTGSAQLTYRILWDALGRQVTETSLNAGGQEVRQVRAYDGVNRPTFESDWMLSTTPTPFPGTTHSYDALGRVLESLHTDGSQRTYAYQGIRRADHRIHGVGQNGVLAEWEYTYDAFGNIVVVFESALGGTEPETNYEYDGRDGLKSVIQTHDGDSRTRTFEYDSLGQLRLATEPESGTRKYDRYDAKGHLRIWLDAAQTEFTHEYDLAERLSKTWAKALGGSPVLYKAFAYDTVSQPNCSGAYALGSLTESYSFNLTSRNVTEYRCYEDLASGTGDGQVTKLLHNLGTAGLQFKTSFGYDSLGNRSQIDYPTLLAEPSRRLLTQTRSHGHLTSIAEPGRTYVSGVTTNPAGGVRHMNYGNGCQTDFVPDSRNRLSEVTHKAASGSSLFSQTAYEYDGAGNLLSYKWLPSNRVDKFDYTRFLRLKSANVASQSGAVHQGSWSYDAFGNILTYVHDGSSVLPPSPSYPNNRLTFAGSSYDDNGNFLGDGQCGRLFAYVFSNRLVQFEPYSPSPSPFPFGCDHFRQDYDYDAFDRRVGRLHVYLGGYTAYIRDLSGAVLAEFEAPNPALPFQWAQDYVYLNDKMLATVSPSGGGLPSVAYYQWDLVGSSRVQTDAVGALFGRRDYWPFGPSLEATGSPWSTHEFMGHERDQDFGIDYMMARYYEGSYGRFLSVDPGNDVEPRNPQSWNKYTFVRNNPINRVDPDGRLSFIVTAGLGALENAAFQIAINKLEGKTWSEGVLGEMGVGAAIGATGVGLATLADKGLDAYRAAKAAKAIDKAADSAKATVELSKEAQRGIRSLDKQIAKHEQKLAEFKKSPTPRPGTEGVSSEIQQASIEGRIKHLEHEIQTFRENIEKIRRGDM